jgi:hypothetical protein
MKKVFVGTGLLLFTLFVTAQTNYAGGYGYYFNPPANTGNDKDATGPKGTLVLLKMEGNKYRFWLDVTLGWPNYNVGETDGTVTFVNDTASFDNTFEDAEHPCILKFKITNNTININSMSSSFNCGFGNGVNADGDYAKSKVQPVLNNDWLKKEYFQSPQFIITDNKAEIYQDENCLRPFSAKQYFVKGDILLSISETEKTVYTEYIAANGKFVYGWLKKSAIKIISTK